MTSLGQRFKSSLLRALTFYTNDFKALTEDGRGKPCSETARTAYDVTYELAVVNEEWNRRLNGKESSPFPDGWIKAPAEFQNEEAALARLTETTNALAESIGNLKDEDFDKEIQMGPMKWTYFDLVSIAVGHMMYHNGQICFIQTLHGDTEMHWM
jgi:uncharacterized damage-inducible protein DinB